MKSRCIALFLLFSPTLFWGKDFSDFDLYQKKLERSSVQRRIDTFLKKEDALDLYYDLGENSLILYSGPKGQKERSIEYTLHFRDQMVEWPEKSEKREGLAGVKIAIDPGHYGGLYAQLEERYIDIADPNKEGGKIQFDEGTLSFLTASYLKELLEKEGALVLLTREGIGKGAAKDDFFDWLKKNPHHWTGTPLPKIFRSYFNPLDLRARAEKINQFQPDLTIIIHFNSHQEMADLPSNHFTTMVNFNLVFVPGAFCKKELSDQDSRYEFLRLICSQDLEDSLQLSRHLLSRFTKRLNVAVVQDSDEISYLNRVCIKLEEGIYARNLALTRLVHGPICYGETLIQNNLEECQSLTKKDFQIQGVPCSSRLKEVAEAYFEGIKSYLLEP